MSCQENWAKVHNVPSFTPELFPRWQSGCEGFSDLGSVLGRKKGETPMTLSTTLAILCSSFLSDILQLAHHVEMLYVRMLSATPL